MIYRGAITLDKRKDTRCSLDGLNSQDVKRSIRERKKDRDSHKPSYRLVFRSLSPF